MEEKVVSVDLLENKNSKWLKFKKITYSDRFGNKRPYEMVERAGHKSLGVDAVVVIPILKGENGQPDELILVRQFRPPVGAKVLEFPAGLIDKGESPVQSAERELKEETGFIGKVSSVADGGSNKDLPLVVSGGMTNENCCMVTISCLQKDNGNAEAMKRKYEQEDENIEVLRFKMDNLFDNLVNYCTETKTELDAKLYTFSLGNRKLAKF